jgi:hypothetical protein
LVESSRDNSLIACRTSSAHDSSNLVLKDLSAYLIESMQHLLYEMQ